MYRNYVEIVVEQVGTWFRWGIADSGKNWSYFTIPATRDPLPSLLNFLDVALDDGNLLGGQSQGILNIGYCKSGYIYYSYRGSIGKKVRD